MGEIRQNQLGVARMEQGVQLNGNTASMGFTFRLAALKPLDPAWKMPGYVRGT